jgi:hypothetical protein
MAEMNRHETGHVAEGEGAELLGELEALLSRFVAFPSRHARAAVTLWIVHCHALSAFESTPRLALLSPEKGSGKTRTLEVIQLVAPNPIHAVNMGAAALFRIVADQQPALLLDEADTYLGTSVAKQHEDIRGLINAGHRRGAKAYRGEVSGKTVGVVEFPAFAACALAGIGDLPDTILDRSVIVGMKRRAPEEHVEPFRERVVRAECEQLRDRIAAWADKQIPALQEAWPEMPDGITDRAADVWEPLIAIADQAGGKWPDRARAAAVALNNQRAERDPSLGVQLLADCRRILDDHKVDRITTEHLVEALVALEESPWGELRQATRRTRPRISAQALRRPPRHPPLRRRHQARLPARGLPRRLAALPPSRNGCCGCCASPDQERDRHRVTPRRG